MYKQAMKCGFNPLDIFRMWKYKVDEFRANPTFFRTFGTCIFCGAQGYGKTLSAVQYVLNLRRMYPRAILVSNVSIKSCPFNTEMFYDGKEYKLRRIDTFKEVNTDIILSESLQEGFEPVNIEYTGLDMLKYVNNREYGVIFLIDELHLELNSLESKNIDIEVMVEISQQRKQRKHIVGTSQIFMRLAKPLREQIHDIVICQNILGCIQYNKWIDGSTATEENGKLVAECKGHFIWTHKAKYYEEYDTYTKMKRYNQEWQGRKRIDMYRKEAEYLEFHK